MNPLLEVWLIVERELRKTFRSAKGLLMLLLSVLGATAESLRVPKFEEAMREAQKAGPAELHQVKAQFFGDMYMDSGTGERLADAPVKLVFLFFLAVWLTPLVVTILGFDGVPSDMQFKSVRYWTLRTRRASYYVGKFAGTWLVVAIIMLVMHALIWSITIARGEASASDTLSWGLRFYAVSLPIMGAWCGIATLVSSFFRTPFLSLLLTCAVFFALFFAGALIGRTKQIEPLQWLYPNTFDGWMLSPNTQHAVLGLVVTLGFAAVTTAVGAVVFTWRDV